MSLTTVIADLSGTNQEIFELVKARTVTTVGRISAAEQGAGLGLSLAGTL